MDWKKICEYGELVKELPEDARPYWVADGLWKLKQIFAIHNIGTCWTVYIPVTAVIKYEITVNEGGLTYDLVNTYQVRPWRWELPQKTEGYIRIEINEGNYGIYLKDKKEVREFIEAHQKFYREISSPERR